jgi:hypothetical protein
LLLPIRLQISERFRGSAEDCQNPADNDVLWEQRAVVDLPVSFHKRIRNSLIDSFDPEILQHCADVETGIAASSPVKVDEDRHAFIDQDLFEMEIAV